MKKILLILLAVASFASAGTPIWATNVYIHEIWVAPGPTPVVRLRLSSAPGGYNSYYAFYLNPTGNAEMLRIAEEAVAQNLPVSVYVDPGNHNQYITGLSAPDVSYVSADPLYTLSIVR